MTEERLEYLRRRDEHYKEEWEREEWRKEQERLARKWYIRFIAVICRKFLKISDDNT
jgi:hypothetical protein